ncbi:MAG TPA: glycosyltransferase family 4 protein [Gemmatimonadaceae bacterium]|nr:glycosyltransferase family 4 protein [Gemmatimonadaceae bacterium]
MIARPGLGVITFAPRGGGVAYVGRLLQRALADATGAAPWSVELWPGHRGSVRPHDAIRLMTRLAAGQLRRRADWVMCNHVAIARAQLALPAWLRRPYAVFVHDVEAWAEDLPAPRFEALRRASLRIANSVYTAERVEAAHPRLATVGACPLGLLEDGQPGGGIDVSLLEAAGPRPVLIVGRIKADERYKGHDALITAWPKVAAAAPDSRLVIAGWGDDVERLRASAARAGVGDRVLFCGFVSDATLQALYERAAVYAMPSVREGFGLAYLEAMRAGVPCIGSPRSAAREVIVDGETGFLVDDADALAASLVTLLTDEDRRRAMGIAGRRRYRDCFTYECFKRRLLALLETCFAQPDHQAMTA